jgi:hypothetical protein
MAPRRKPRLSHDAAAELVAAIWAARTSIRELVRAADRPWAGGMISRALAGEAPVPSWFVPILCARFPEWSERWSDFLATE